MAFGSFAPAVAYFRRKINFPSTRWDDLMHGEHACGFMVVGVARMDVLDEIRRAVDAAISQGETLRDFQKRFYQIVQQYGWPGGPGNDSQEGFDQRIEEIYHTNLRTAYMAGRWETLKHFPYLKYDYFDSNKPNEHWQAWDGLIIAHDDPWWQTHYPPNGKECRGTVNGFSEVRMRVEGKTAPDPAPGPSAGDPSPEWAYHVGESAHSLTAIETFAQKVMRLSADVRDAVLEDARKRKEYWSSSEWAAFIDALERAKLAGES